MTTKIKTSSPIDNIDETEMRIAIEIHRENAVNLTRKIELEKPLTIEEEIFLRRNDGF